MTLRRHAPIASALVFAAAACSSGNAHKMEPKVPETTSAEQPGSTASAGNARVSNPNAEVPPEVPQSTTSQSAEEKNLMMGGSPTSAPSRNADSTGGTTASAGLTDDQILHALHVTNTGEVDEGKLAQSKAKDARVKQFAATMVRHHTEADSKGYEVARRLKVTLSDSVLANQLQSDGHRTIAQLRAQSGSDFDRSYIDAQVMEHRDFLSVIDSQLMTNAKSIDLRTHLQMIREQVQSHLREAQAIQNSLSAR